MKSIHPTGPSPYCSRLKNAQRPVLIVVDDDSDDITLLKRALHAAGDTASVWWAHDAQAARAILTYVECPGARICVVTDVRLLGMDGFDLIDQIKARKASGHVKCAFLTGMANERTEDCAYDHGADAFFVKPFEFAELVEIAQALQKLAAGEPTIAPGCRRGAWA